MTVSYVRSTLQALFDQIVAEPDPMVRAQAVIEYRQLVPTLGRRMAGSAMYRMRMAGYQSKEVAEIFGSTKQTCLTLIYEHCERNALPLPLAITHQHRIDPAQIVAVPPVEG